MRVRQKFDGPAALPALLPADAKDPPGTWCINGCDDNYYCSSEEFVSEDVRAAYAYQYCERFHWLLVGLVSWCRSTHVP